MAHATRLPRRDATRLTRREPAVQLRTDPELRIRPRFKLPDWLSLASWSFGGLFSSFPTAGKRNQSHSPYGSLCIRGLRRIRSPPVSVNNHNADLDLVGSLDVRGKGSFKLIMSPDASLAGEFETTKSISGL